MGVALIKWIVIALLVAGTFGFVWTAPWKDDVDKLTEDVTTRLRDTYATIGIRADNGACTALKRPPDKAEREAFAYILDQLRTNPAAELKKLDSPKEPARTVRGFAEDEAANVAGCFAKVTVRGKGWDDLKRRLDEGIAAAR